MSSPDQRKSGTGKKSEHSTVASSPRSHPPAVDSSPSRSSSTKKRSSDDEVSDEDEAEAEGDEEGTSMPSKHRRGRDAHKPTLRTAINFTQLLVFGCLMLLGLNLFIAYHNMLITQPILFQLETQVPAIESAVEALATQLEELQQAIEQLREGGFSSADVETPQDTTELIETEEAEPPAEPEEDDSSAPFTTDYISSEDWSIDYEALDKLILQQMGRDIAEAEAKTAYWGGNNMMLLTPEDIAALNVYQNWSQTVHADGSITASNAGSSHNRTAVFLLTIGQLDPITLTPRDIILLNPDSADRIAVASRAIKKDEVFWRADRKHCLTTQIAEESDVGQVLKDHPRLGDEMIVLTVFLLYERTQNPRSPLKFWYDMLPASFAFMPTMYSPDDLTMIENTLAADQIFQYQLNYREEYLALSVALEDFARKFSFAQYCWARYAIATRAFDVSMGKELIDPKTGQFARRSFVPAEIRCAALSSMLTLSLYLFLLLSQARSPTPTPPRPVWPLSTS
jgi:hypothetical protein